MLRAINFILNQLGFIVVVIAALLLYYEWVTPNWKFFAILGLLLLVILAASEFIYTMVKKAKKVAERARND